MSYYEISIASMPVNRPAKRISTHWNDLAHIWNCKSMNGKTGREVAADAYLALDWLAQLGHSAHNRCHQGAIWPDGVKTLSNGSTMPLDHDERLGVMTTLLRKIMKLGHSSYKDVFIVKLVE